MCFADRSVGTALRQRRPRHVPCLPYGSVPPLVGYILQREQVVNGRLRMVQEATGWMNEIFSDRTLEA